MSKAQHGPLLFFWGSQDEHIGSKAPGMISESLRKARKSHTSVEFSDAGHGFFCDARDGYHPYAAHQAWAQLLAFLECHLKE
jgi:carboxymethylenebutenolidase